MLDILLEIDAPMWQVPEIKEAIALCVESWGNVRVVSVTERPVEQLSFAFPAQEVSR